MRFSMTFPVLASALLSIATSKEVGYFDSSECVDRSAFESCYEKADQYLASCISNNCVGGSDSCSDACGGSVTCIQNKCPNLGVDCMKACDCAKTVEYIDCIATSCWNQAYSCEYQATINDLVGTCVNMDLDSIPFWPPPDDATTGCSCNMGKILYTQTIDTKNLDNCYDKVTELNRAGDYDRAEAYGRQCLCCGQSSAMSTYWDVCPKTDPSTLGADIAQVLLGHNDWDACGPRLSNSDCVADYGFSNVTNFYSPGKFPVNGTETLSNTGSPITAPISGPTFTWTFKGNLHPITAVPMSNKADATKAQSSGSTSTPTGESGAGLVRPALTLMFTAISGVFVFAAI
ncbi:hypothetical protein BDV25DRAFT_38002 [Aspergillus avenaceus]|uniref:Extracellular membrane protein CFEM domain-containing protein n=1 Tax=Aspergillus avenaceus TaxID=36643 RepID=A0A5N6U9N5_ASPAV|nr:hypothetical protein BDV25DRAFT_38002 [Aspergillus avenaceus]